ncbi:MAG: GGDEF domain-containing protein [Nitriliruptoraceae bacterium]
MLLARNLSHLRREAREVARPGVIDRARGLLNRVSGGLSQTSSRVVVLGGGIAATIGLHVATGDTNLAFAAIPFILLAGLAGNVRFALVVATVSAVGHTIVDVITTAGLSNALGIAVRTAVLLGIGVVGAVGTRIEEQREQALRRAVIEEPITGLLNVRAFYDELEKLRAAGTPFAILLADIRGMKALNDRYGHPTGTEAMRALAHVLRRSAGPDVLASRLGSDEVAVALVGSDRERCRAVIDKIVGRLHDEQVSLPDGERFEVHAAYGIARFPEDGADEVAVLRAADRAKDQAKAAGLDRVGTASGDVL